jgi:D-3-phosphoglycerate dehydrogenase
MNLEELAAIGIEVHVIKGYGDTAVAECTFALMWSAAKGLARMDREMRAGNWLRTDGVQLTGKTLGLIGFGSIAAEVARLALGCGMKVLAWNRSPKTHAHVDFVELDRLMAESHVVSLHLLLDDRTRGFLSRERIAAMRSGAILVNTARGALVDEAAMIDALRSGHLLHAGLDVFAVEPLPPGHALTTLPNVTLSAHSAFRTPEAGINLIEAALEHCRRIARIARIGDA